MRTSIRIPAAIALSLILTVPALAQSTHQQHAAAPADAAKAAAPAVDPDKAYALNQEYVAKTAELRGKITAKKAELEALLVSKPDDTAAVKKLVADIAALRGQLDEQTTLFRIRYAKETGTPMRLTHDFGHKGMMDGKDMEGCKMMGKGMMMGGMDHGAGKGGMMMGMDQGQGKGMNMPVPATDAKAAAPQQAN